MSNDLISRSALLKSISGIDENVVYCAGDMKKLVIIEAQRSPTAYDMDRVIERLEERKNLLLKDYVLANKADEVKERTMARINEIDGLIDIVKSGGIE